MNYIYNQDNQNGNRGIFLTIIKMWIVYDLYGVLPSILFMLLLLSYTTTNYKISRSFIQKWKKGTKSLPRGRRDRASLTVLLIQAQVESPWWTGISVRSPKITSNCFFSSLKVLSHLAASSTIILYSSVSSLSNTSPQADLHSYHNNVTTFLLQQIFSH